MESQIPGVQIRRLERFSDARGWLVEVFRADEAWSSTLPVMAYVSITRPGAVRGPHEHRFQADMMCFPGPGDFELWLWDNRKDSPTYGRREVWAFGQGSPGGAVIPPGVVHAYRNSGDSDGLTVNLPDQLYGGPGKLDPIDEIRHESDSSSLFRLSP